MDIKNLIAMVNRPDQVGTLSTVDSSGNVNSAIFGSAHFLSEETMALALGKNRSARNLQQTPKAVFTISEPGKTLLEWKGGRIYLEALSFETEGTVFEQMVKNVTEVAGPMAAKMINAVVLFKVTEIRPLLDLNG